tara:strand:- start:2166 stop:2984 length:819 start_codon:yes stop_codon:yes gene_type:complete
MLTKRIIPCLDVDQGRVVKGVSFVNLRDAGNPVELARFYDQEGADELVFLDITASSDNRNIMKNVVQSVSEQVFIPLTVGGGIRTREDIRAMLESGADKVSLNSAVLSNPEIIYQSADFFGSQCIVSAIDAKKINNNSMFSDHKISEEYSIDSSTKWEVYSHGGRKPTGIDVVKWAKYVAKMGAGEILLTSMDRDGQESGYDIELLREVSNQISIPVIASGGAGKMDHFKQAIELGKADAVLAASTFHFGTFSINQVKKYLDDQHIPIRKTY